MTQHIDAFLNTCLTVTADGSLVSLDEFEGLYVYWCSTHDEDALETSEVLGLLASEGVESTQRNGVDYVEGLLLTGPVAVEFILSCDFSGAWGQPDSMELADLREVATA
ncbi:hypothetical protein GM708_07025 [Vibrio cholerae]|jgi:hypothetical protein|nr:hypothetical protein [Vibrio cholerae]